MNRLKFVKFIVFVLSFLLIFGTLCAGTIIYKKVGGKTKKEVAELNLNQPKDSHIADMRIDGKNLYVLIKGTKTPDRVIIIDTSVPNIVTTIKNF